MSEKTPKCIWCKADAPDNAFWLTFMGKPLPLCDFCFTMGRELVQRGSQMRAVLGQAGINIGIPKKDVSNG